VSRERFFAANDGQRRRNPRNRASRPTRARGATHLNGTERINGLKTDRGGDERSLDEALKAYHK
jgi:hypothetical protein